MIISPEFIIQVINNLHLGVIVTNKTGDVIRYNKSLIDYFEIKPDADNDSSTRFLIKSIIRNSELSEVFQRALKEVKIIKTHSVIELNHKEVNAENFEKFFRVDVYPLTDGNNFPDGVVALLTDITPLNENDRTIKTSLLNLKTVINNTNYSIYSVDTSLNIIEFNNTYKEDYKRLYGDEIKIGDSALKPAMPKEIVEDWKILYNKALKGNKVVEHYDFKNEPYLITLTPIADNGHVTGVTVFAENIKDEIKLRNDYKESQFRYKFAMDVSNSGFWDWDMITNEIYFSTIWMSMLGYNKSELEQTYYGWERLVHRDDLPKVLDSIQKHVKGETETYKSEARLLCKNGDYKWVLATGRIVEWIPDGRPKRFVGIHVDIDYLKRTETDLKKRNEQLNEVAYITSHGVRKSLANILGLTKIIDLNKFAEPENREMMSNLLKAADELNSETIKLNEAMKHLDKDLFKEVDGTRRIIKQIMIVDDDPINNFITSKYVQKAGLSSKIFENPMRALEYLKIGGPSKPDIILLDINMPGMDGFQFLSEMEKEHLNTDVIILTSSINIEDRNRASGYKAVIDFWVKPLNYSKIVEFNLQPEHN